MNSWSARKALILLAVACLGPLGFKSSRHPLASTPLDVALTFGAEMVVFVAIAVIAFVAFQLWRSKISTDDLHPPQWNRSPFDKSRPLDFYEFSAYGLCALSIGYVVSQFQSGLDQNCIVPLFAGIGMLIGVRLSLILLGGNRNATP